MKSLNRKLIKDWQDWIKSEKRLSFNTLDSYVRDLTLFFNFLKNIKIKILNLMIWKIFLKMI